MQLDKSFIMHAIENVARLDIGDSYADVCAADIIGMNL